MKNQESLKPTAFASTTASSNKLGRFRFPFKQKSSTSLITTNPTASSTAGFFNIRKLGTKPSTPVLSQHRKTVSFSGTGNMDWKKKVDADHTDVAYREAVSRLRTILSPRPPTPTSGAIGSPAKVKGNYETNATQNLIDSPPSRKGRFTSGLRSIFAKDGSTYNAQNVNPTQLTRSLTLNNAHGYVSPYIQPRIQNSPSSLSAAGENDLFGFIEKQGEYIVQLEKETKYCRDELSTMLEKVRDVISENEALHEKQKKDILTSMIQQLDEKTDGYGRSDSKSVKKNTVGKSDQVIRDSRIAELEAQLSQARRALRAAQEDILEIRKGKGDSAGTQGQSGSSNFVSCELHRSEIENLSREKDDLLETLNKFKQMVADLRDRESEATKKVKNSLEIVDQMRDEKTQSDLETRRLKEELDRHQQRVREMIQDHSKKLHEEKIQVEKKYRQEIDHLNNEMNQEMDSSTKARLDLERQKRIEADLRRELQHKMSTIDDLRQEMQIKINHLQAELSHTLMQKSAAEQDLINSRLQCEKIERDGKQDATRLQAEITGLRKRLEQTDVDLTKSQEVIVRLNENISQLQREASLARIRLEGHLSANSDIHDGDVNSMIQTMEDKHSRDMTDLEQLIQVQNSLLDKLRNECKILTDKLEETSRQYKEDLMDGLHSCVATIQKNLTSNSLVNSDAMLESQSILLDELRVIVNEMNAWIQQTSTSEPDSEKDGEAKIIVESTGVSELQAEVETEMNETTNSDQPEEVQLDAGAETDKEAEKDVAENEAEGGIEKHVSDEKAIEESESKKDDQKDDVIEINSRLLDWAKRIENVVERFSNCFPSKVDS